VGGFEIRALAVNVLGSEAEDRVVTREERPIEVDLTITVMDEANNYILDLEQGDFSVLEDGVPQEILRFSAELTPVSMAIVLDTSGSMRRRMDSVQKAASQFVSQIKPVDRAMILEFSDGVRMTQGLTSDIPALKRAIEKSAAKGGTALYDAVIDAVRRLQRMKGRTSVILLTDGKDENNAGTAAGSRHTLAECVETAKEAGVTIYTLGLGANIAKDVLTQIAQQTGGRAYFPPTVADLAEVYGKIAKELRSQYTLSYSSSNRIRDGAWRAIEIKVAGHSYIIRTKPGYFAPKR
jgi:Ca-activated chloride channel family protein